MNDGEEKWAKYFRLVFIYQGMSVINAIHGSRVKLLITENEIRQN